MAGATGSHATSFHRHLHERSHLDHGPHNHLHATHPLGDNNPGWPGPDRDRNEAPKTDRGYFAMQDRTPLLAGSYRSVAPRPGHRHSDRDPAVVATSPVARAKKHDHVPSRGHVHDRDRAHRHDAPARPDSHSGADKSFITRIVLSWTATSPLLHAIIIDKNSRRIFYFMLLNFLFMSVQAFYGYLSNSLGLISDSIHMFFDCVALLVGLIAAVVSKWPPSPRFPCGFGKIESLSGFANGILLILLSIEIAFEAFERLWEGTTTGRLSELFVVSTMGLVVNLVGMSAFGHHHHHHHHHHEHSHGHGDARSHDHAHSHCPGRDKGHARPHQGNDNMHGIYLHVLADTLGSVSVVVSTALTYFTGWSGWDPIASCLISVLILLSSRPLVVSCARRLLLSVPDDAEYTLRNTLSGITQQRGVVGYATPKFWLDESDGGTSSSADAARHHAHVHAHVHPPDEGERDGRTNLFGMVHVLAARGADAQDVRRRVREFLQHEGVNAVVQIEDEGEPSCWCGLGRSPVSAPGVVGVAGVAR